MGEAAQVCSSLILESVVCTVFIRAQVFAIHYDLLLYNLIIMERVHFGLSVLLAPLSSSFFSLLEYSCNAWCLTVKEWIRY